MFERETKINYEKSRLLAWLLDICERENLDTVIDSTKYNEKICKLYFHSTSEDMYYRLEIDFGNLEIPRCYELLNTKLCISQSKNLIGKTLQWRSWRYSDSQNRFVPSKNSKEILEDYIVSIIQKYTRKEEKNHMNTNDIATLFRSKFGSWTCQLVKGPYCYKIFYTNFMADVNKIYMGRIESNKYHVIFIGDENIFGHPYKAILNKYDDAENIDYRLNMIVDDFYKAVKIYFSGYEPYTRSASKYYNNDTKPKPASRYYNINIEKVIFNNPATIVIWKDGTKTVVKKQDGDSWDEEKGLAMAIVKRVCGDKGNYYELFKKWLPEEKDPLGLFNTLESILKEDECNQET